MRTFKVYLAGPIAGLPFDEAESWRELCKRLLAPQIECYSPLRGKKALRSCGPIGTQEYHMPLTKDREVLARDHYDCSTADLLLVNYLGVKRPSRGTDMEIAWAKAYSKPVVLAAESGGVALDHPMIRAATDFHAETLEDAILAVRSVLLSD